MYNKEALKVFSRRRVDDEMIRYLVSTTESIVQVRRQKVRKGKIERKTGMLVRQMYQKEVPLAVFIRKLICYSNVQTPTLMSALVYLVRLRNILPGNATGGETTAHRIFMASLLLSAKTLNDSSPLNRHWARYTDGVLSLEEVNLVERELISLLNWNLNIKEYELYQALLPFLVPIQIALNTRRQLQNGRTVSYYRSCYRSKEEEDMQRSTSSLTSINSNGSGSSSQSTLSLTSNTSGSTTIDDGSFADAEALQQKYGERQNPLTKRNFNLENLPVPLTKPHKYKVQAHRTSNLVSA